MQLFIDCDGVLADFDTHYESLVGPLPPHWGTVEHKDDVDWDIIRRRGNFYLDMPPMPDMRQLWDFVLPFKPIVLTGIPKSVPEAADNKRSWVTKHLGPDVEVRCCLSREKSLNAKPGDVLVDDWIKYRHLWLEAGGIWITHTSAESTIKQLDALMRR